MRGSFTRIHSGLSLPLASTNPPRLSDVRHSVSILIYVLAGLSIHARTHKCLHRSTSAHSLTMYLGTLIPMETPALTMSPIFARNFLPNRFTASSSPLAHRAFPSKRAQPCIRARAAYAQHRLAITTCTHGANEKSIHA